MTLADLQKEAYAIHLSKGWGDVPRTIGEDIALLHSELSEALEEHRKGFKPDEIYHDPNHNVEKPEGIPIELADLVIRLVGFCEKHSIDLTKAIQIKMEYNKTRPYRHGGKVI